MIFQIVEIKNNSTEIKKNKEKPVILILRKINYWDAGTAQKLQQNLGILAYLL